MILKAEISDLPRKLRISLMLFLIASLVLTIGFNYGSAVMRNGSFYLSESLMFSSYWIQYALFLPMQWALLKRFPAIPQGLFLTLAIVMMHILIYPAMVWILSKLFYYHTFSYAQTLNFTLDAYAYFTILFYSGSLLLWPLLKFRETKEHILSDPAVTSEPVYFKTILVPESSHRSLAIPVEDILYFISDSPYIRVQHLQKKYMLRESLKSIESRVNPELFSRVHKSCIVNLRHVNSIRSRKNGDYEIQLSDQTNLRLSRNFTKDFKARLEKTHRLNHN